MKVLFQILGLTAAIPMYRSCLRISENVAGSETRYKFSNRNQLIGSSVNDEMRLHSFRVCTNSNGYITGL